MMTSSDLRAFNKGRPKTGAAKSAAQRQREVRERQKAVAIAKAEIVQAAIALHEEIFILASAGNYPAAGVLGKDEAETLRNLATLAKNQGDVMLAAEKKRSAKDGRQ